MLNCPSISCKFSNLFLRSVTPSFHSSEHPAAFDTLKFSSSSPDSSSKRKSEEDIEVVSLPEFIIHAVGN